MATRRARLRAQYPGLIGSIPEAIRDRLSDDELEARLAHADHLERTAQSMTAVDAQGHLDLRHRVLHALPSAEVAQRVRNLRREADGAPTTNDRSAFHSAVHELIAGNPMPPGYGYGETRADASKAASPASGATSSTVAHKAASTADSRNSSWYKREFARLDLKEKAENYERMVNQLAYSDRELVEQYRKMAAECRDKLARKDY